jgi:hypothetical protein
VCEIAMQHCHGPGSIAPTAMLLRLRRQWRCDRCSTVLFTHKLFLFYFGGGGPPPPLGTGDVFRVLPSVGTPAHQ